MDGWDGCAARLPRNRARRPAGLELDAPAVGRERVEALHDDAVEHLGRHALALDVPELLSPSTAHDERARDKRIRD